MNPGMNPDDSRLVSDWIHEYAAHRVPAHLDAVLRETGGRRQRPAWSIPERWIPMDLATRAGTLAQPRLGRAAVVALLILAIAGLAILAIGSSRPRLPAPYGPARNGFQVTSTEGDIYRVDPATGAKTPLITGPSWDFGAGFSRDGTQFLFLRTTKAPTTAGPGVTLAVANADGTNVRDLVGPVSDLGWADWSPGGRRIAFNSEPDNLTSLLNVVDVASGKVTTVDVGTDAFYATWLPPDGNEIVFRRETKDPALMAVHPDGTGLRLLTLEPALDKDDFQGISISPDGRSISFARWTGSQSQLLVLDVATGRSRVLPTPPGTWQHAYGVFSPDARQIAYWRSAAGSDDDLQLVVAPADGSSLGRVLGGATAEGWSGQAFQPVIWAPDGTGIVASVGTDDYATQWWMPIDGSPARQLGAGASEFVDVQRLAP